MSDRHVTRYLLKIPTKCSMNLEEFTELVNDEVSLPEKEYVNNMYTVPITRLFFSVIEIATKLS